MDFGTELDPDQVVVRVSTEFIVKLLTRSDGDGLQEITGHEYDDQVADGDVGPRVECGVLLVDHRFRPGGRGGCSGRSLGNLLSDVHHNGTLKKRSIILAMLMTRRELLERCKESQNKVVARCTR